MLPRKNKSRSLSTTLCLSLATLLLGACSHLPAPPPDAPGMCVREDGDCSAPEAKCCGGLVCVGVAHVCMRKD